MSTTRGPEAFSARVLGGLYNHLVADQRFDFRVTKANITQYIAAVLTDIRRSRGWSLGLFPNADGTVDGPVVITVQIAGFYQYLVGDQLLIIDHLGHGRNGHIGNVAVVQALHHFLDNQAPTIPNNYVEPEALCWGLGIETV